MARGLKLRTPRNADLQRTVILRTSGEAYPLTGWTGELNVYATPGEEPILTVTETPSAAGSVVAFTDPEGGEMAFLIAETDIDALPEGESASDPAFFTYDLMLTDADGMTSRFLFGQLVVDPAGGTNGSTYGDNTEVEVNGQSVQIEIESGSSIAAVQAAEATRGYRDEAEESAQDAGQARDQAEAARDEAVAATAGKADSDLSNVAGSAFAGVEFLAGAGATARNLADRFGDTTTFRDFGATGDGSTNDRVAIQAALDSGVSTIYGPAGDYLIAGVLNLPSGVDLVMDPACCLIDAAVVVQGSVGSEIAFTGAVDPGAQTLPLASTGLASGDWLHLKGCINVLSTDAGDLQLGTEPSASYTMFTEFVRLTGVPSGASASVEGGVLYPYTITPAANSGSRTVSTARKVTFATGRIRGGKFTGRAAGYNAIITRRWCREFVVEDVVFELDDSTFVQAVAEFTSLNCTDRNNVVRRKSYDGFQGTGVSLRNSFVPCASQGWTGRGNTVDGGHQACDITYLNGASEETGVSTACSWVGNTVVNAYEVGTTHQGALQCRLDGNTGLNVVNGVRLRSIRSSASYNVLKNRRSASGYQGSGVFLAEGYMEGNLVVGNVVEGFLYGCQVQLKNSVAAVTLPGRALIEANSFSFSSYGVFVNEGDANTAVKGATVRGNNFQQMALYGVYVASYANGTVIEGNVFHGPFGASALGAIRWEDDIQGLCIRNNIANNLGAAVYGLRGPGSTTCITDTTTFPGGNADAKWVIDGNRAIGTMAGETTGIIRDLTAFEAGSGSDWGSRTYNGKLVAKQIAGVSGNVIEAQDNNGNSLGGFDATALSEGQGTLWMTFLGGGGTRRKRVEVGAIDSGGAGYRMLRVPNA